MFQKSKRKLQKTESSGTNEVGDKNLSKISIKISEFENLVNFADDDEKTELELSVKFKENLVDIQKLTTLKNECELTFTTRVDVDDEINVMNFFSSPVLITLSRQEDSSTIGHANLDLYPLCSDRIESFTCRLKFEREIENKPAHFTRKISFKAEASCDLPILRKPIANSVHVKFDSMYNLPEGFDDAAEISVGVTIPLGEQLSESKSFTTNLGSCKSQNPEASKWRWSNLANISGKGSESQFPCKPKNRDHDDNLQCNPNSILNFHFVNRTFLSENSQKYFHDHIRRSLKFPVEVSISGKHYFGLIDATEFLHVEKKQVQASIPLMKFNNILLTKSSNVRSAFYKPISAMNPKTSAGKNKKDLGKKTTKNIPSIISFQTEEKDEEEPFVNEDGQQVFIVVEVELEKSLNREVFEDCYEILVTEDNQATQLQLENPETLKNFKSTLEVITKNIQTIYKNETDVNKVLMRMNSDGYFSSIEDQLLSQMPLDDFSNSKNDFLCKLTSNVLNNKLKVHDDQRQDLLAQVFNFLGKENQANEIFLRRIYVKKSEESWISYSVHCLRKQEFNKSMACVDKALTFDQHSIVGHILKAYVEFKQKKLSESKRLIDFMQYKHGDSVELSMIKHFLEPKSRQHDEFSTSKFKVHLQLQKIYESPEVLWFATNDSDKFLSWQDESIKSTVLFIKLGCYDFAELALSEYYRKRGVNVNYSYLLAVIDAVKGDYRNALIHLNKISKQDVANHHLNYDKIIVLMSLMLMKIGKWDQDIKLLRSHETIEDKNPENFLINFMLGSHLNNVGEHDKSLKLLIQSHRILPSQLTLMELGKCYQRLNKESSAEKCFHQSISYDQDSRDAWLHLYNIYLKTNRDDLVQSCLEVLKLD